VAKRRRKQDDENPDDNLLDDLEIEPEDCGVYHNIRNVVWGATVAQTTAAARAEATKYFNALKIKCGNPACPVPKKSMSVGKPRENKLVIPLTPIFGPKVTIPVVISVGFVCDYEIIYGCFKK